MSHRMNFKQLKLASGLLELRRSVKVVWCGSPYWTIAGLGLGIAQALLPLVGLFLLKRIIDGIVAGAGRGLAPAGWKALWLTIDCAFCVQLLIALCRALTQVVQEAQGSQVTEYMQDLLHRKSIDVDLEYYETAAFKNTFHRAQQEAPYRPTRIVQSLAQLSQSGFSLFALSGLLLFSIHWTFGLILAAAAVPGLWVRFRQARRMFEWQVERTPIERQADYYNWMLTGSHHAKENRLFGIGSVLRERAAGLRCDLARGRLKFARQRAGGEFVTQSTAAILMFGAFAVLARRAVEGAISIGEVVVVYQALQRGLGYFQEFLASLASLYENNLFVRNAYAFLDQRVRLPEPSRPRPVPHPIREGIRFEKVRFQYRDSSRPCLEEVSLTIGPGE